MTEWFYVLAVLAVIGLLAGISAWRGRTWRYPLASLLFAVGGFSTITLLAIGLMLTGKLWGDVSARGAPVSAPRPASVASSASLAERPTGGVKPTSPPDADGKRGSPAEDGGKDALSNAMTAIGTVIAVVTLVLSVGTSWFAERLATLERERARLEALATRLQQERKREVDLERKRMLVLDALPAAKLALSAWVKSRGSRAAVDYTHAWCLQLEMLSSDDRAVRFRAFAELSQGIRSKDPRLQPIERYTELCHDFVIERLQFNGGADPRPTRDLLAEVERGLWCRVFDNVEQERLYRLIAS